MDGEAALATILDKEHVLRGVRIANLSLAGKPFGAFPGDAFLVQLVHQAQVAIRADERLEWQAFPAREQQPCTVYTGKLLPKR